MHKRNSMGLAVLMLSTGFAAHAQDEPAKPERIERVEITGSRILSIAAASPSPVQVMSSADIAASGVANLQDLLQKSPVFGTPGISRTNSNFSTSSAGVATINLRNLGANRTLVLVNGRRYVSGVPATASVDLNTIPAAFIERVEVLTGGASASYGSDAVGGVVNFILKKDLRGLYLDAKLGESSKHDDRLKSFSATYGMGSEDGRDFLVSNFSVSQQGAVYSRDREASAVDQFSKALAETGDPADLFKATRPFYSSFAPQGRFFYTGALTPGGAVAARNFTYDANGKEVPFSTNGPAGDGVGARGFNRSDFRTIAIPTDRLMIALNGEKSLSDTHNVFFESMYASTRTTTRLEPVPIDSSGGANPIYTGGKFVPAEFLVDGVMTRNPLVPDYLFSRATDRDGDGARDYNFTRRLSDIALRGQKADRDTFRFLTGVRGELGTRWNYDVYGAYGFTKEAQTGSGQVNVLNFRNALEAIPDVNDINRNGNRTEAICRDALARAQGCVPINVFGAGTISAAAANYVGAPTSLISKITQRFVGANLSGEAFDLPAGPLGVAVGVEYRKETSLDEADALTQLGLNAGNARPRTEGSFDVKEIYAELRAPLLTGLPLIRQLDSTLAARRGDYSTVGGVTSWTTGLDWAIDKSARVRVTRSTSVRAPDIGELFQGPSQTFPSGLADPCVGVTATSTTPASARCRQDPGVAANIAANGSFKLTQADLQGVSGFNRGNPRLGAEQGKSFTVGIVLTPDGIDLLRGFTFTADYFDISVAKGINAPGAQYTLDQCYSGDASFCKDITRRPTAVGGGSAGALATVNQAQENTGGLLQRGVDVTAGYVGRVGPGKLTGKLSYTYLIRGFLRPTPEAEPDFGHGEVGASRNRWLLGLGYEIGRFAVNTSTTFIGRASLDDQFLKSNDFPSDAGNVPSKTYFDTQLSYSFAKKQQVYFGVNNLFGTKAPPIISGLPSSVTGAETDSGTYDAIGRRFYVGLRIQL